MDSQPNRGMAPHGQPSRPRLNTRQLECLAWAQHGKSAVDIGQILGLSGRTVEYHFAKALEALGVRTRMQAVIRARELGLLQDDGPADLEEGRAFGKRGRA